MGYNSQGSIVKIIVVMAAIVVIFAGMKTASNLLVPFFLSIFIAIICNPIISKASEFKIPKIVSVISVIAVFVIILMSLANLVGTSLTELSSLLPEYRTQLKERLTWLPHELAKYNIQLSSDIIIEYFDPAAAMGLATSILGGLGGVMTNMFLILITTVFMLFEASSLPKKLFLAMKNPEIRIGQIERFLTSVNNYIAIKTLVSIATGLIVSFMLWLFGLDFYPLWGVLAFLLNYIPNIGSIIAAVPAVTLAILQLGFAEAGFIGLGYIVINTVMGNFVEPRFLGKGLGLSTLFVFLSLIFWGWLLGTAGMILSVPLTMIFKIGLENSSEGRWLAVLLSGDEIIDKDISAIK